MKIKGLPFETNPGMKQFRVDNYIKNMLHELLHRAGVTSHVKFADAARKSLSPEEQEQNPLPPKKSDETYEDYFNQMVNKKCPVPKPKS